MNADDLKAFVKERNEALFSLDEIKILAYCKKYGARVPTNERIFWASVYKAILAIGDAPDELKGKAKNWLIKNNFSLGMGGDGK
jgi:hypothetical protein